MAVKGYIYLDTGRHTIRQTQFFDGVGSVSRFQIPKFAPCLLYSFDTLIFCNSIALLLYLFDTLPFIQSTPQKKRDDHTQTKTTILQGVRPFMGNYPPHNIRPHIPRHNLTNIGVYFLAYYRTKENVYFTCYHCTFLIIHCILIFSSTHFAISSTIICFAVSYIYTFVT